MYTISLRNTVHARPQKLLRLWRHPEVILSEAKNIRSIKVIERNSCRVVTAWEAEIDKAVLHWSQIEELDIKNGIVRFKLKEGEFKKFEGEWQVFSVKHDKTTLVLQVDVDFGIPVLEPYVKNVLERKSRVLFRSLMSSIKKLVECHE